MAAVSTFPIMPGVVGASEKITTLTSATPLTASKYNLTVTANAGIDMTRRPIAALIQCEGFPIRFTTDGTTPTVTAGTGLNFTLGAGDVLPLIGYQNITKFQCINEVASSGSKLVVEYYY